MTRRRRSVKRQSPAQGLRARLDEAEATLAAIRAGEVDALVVSGAGGERTLAIEGATHPYSLLLNAMSDGAALLAPSGTILFVNHRLGEIARAPLKSLPGSLFQRLLVPAERSTFESIFREGPGPSAGEFTMGGQSSPTAVWIVLSTVPLGTYPRMAEADSAVGSARMAIVSDLTDRRAGEATRLELMKRLLSAEDEERRRIARELHDETGQSLTALLVGLRAIEDQATTKGVKSAAKRLRKVAAETVDNVGRLARGLHPSVLDDMGLAAASRRHVNDYVKSYGIPVDLRLGSISPQLPPLVQTTMYRILQEALTNVVRHARARKIGVKLRQEESILELVVRDDGVGFDATAPRDELGGLGLHGMRERVGLLGGSVEIESRPGQGTLLRARISADGAPPPPPPPPETAEPALIAPDRDKRVSN